MKRTLTITILLLFSGVLCAKSTNITLAHIKPYSASYEYFLQSSGEEKRRAGTWFDEIDIADSQITRTVARTPLGQEVDLHRVVAVTKTLQPLYLSQRFGSGLQGIYHSQFEKGELKQFLLSQTGQPARLLSTILSAKIFETQLQGTFAIALPFEQEQLIEVPSYLSGAKPVETTVSYHVKGTEVLELNGTTIHTYKIHQPDSNWTFWVNREMPYLYKVTHPAPDGKMAVSLLRDYKPN